MSALDFTQLTGPDPQADALLAAHVALMRSQSPAESCHVMTASDLQSTGARVFIGRDRAGHVVAVGAIKALGQGAGELKSMHCTQARRGEGLGRALLRHLIAEARHSGLHGLWLETGSEALFAPARALYASEGFVICPPLGDHAADPLSVFMNRPL